VKTLEAYILLKISTQTAVCGFSRTVLERINNKVARISSANLLFGDFDAILKVDVPKIHDIENMVMEEIQMIEGVESTLTLLCVDEKTLE